MKTIDLESKNKNELINLTDQVRTEIKNSQVAEGICVVYCPHTSCGLTINSIADPNSGDDILDVLEQLAPQTRTWKHLGNPLDADAHVKTTLTGSQVVIPISDHTLQIGKYQSILLCDFDGPRKRQVYLSVIGK